MLAPPTRETLLRRLEAIGVTDMPPDVKIDELCKRVLEEDARQIGLEFPLDILWSQHRQDERAGVPADRRRGIDGDQWWAGWELAKLRYGLFGVPALDGGKFFRRLLPQEPRPLPPDPDPDEIELTAEERADQRLRERFARYKDAIATTGKKGSREREVTMAVAIFWRPIRADNHADITALRTGLARLVKFFRDK